MVKKILLPIDFSINAINAVEYALLLYKNDECKFYLLNVFSATGNIIDNFLYLDKGSKLYERAKEKSVIGLSKVLDTLIFSEEGSPKHHFKTISSFNNVVETIKNIVDEKDIEMIVMGTRGKTRSNKTVFGSTAINVMEKVRNCPVLVVPEKASPRMPKEIVFPTGYKTHFKKRELNYLIEIATNCNASIKILHVLKENSLDNVQINNKTLLEEYFENIDHSFHSLRNMEVSSAINCFVESRKSDMVAFINKKYIFFKSMLTHPLVKDITFALKVPILVMHDLKN